MSTILVYHVKDLVTAGGRHLLSEIGDGLVPINFPENHEVVASIEVTPTGMEALDKAYHLTQNIHDSWVRAEYAFLKLEGNLKPDRRSTHIGDVLVLDGTPYVCAPIGWKPISDPNMKVFLGRSGEQEGIVIRPPNNYGRG